MIRTTVPYLIMLIIIVPLQCEDTKVQNREESVEESVVVEESDNNEERTYKNKSRGKFEGKVIGGAEADIESFPHAAFFYPRCNRRNWVCGSSILNQVMVLTAAHCIQLCNNKIDIAVFAGASDVTKCRSVRKITHVEKPDDYSDETLYSDIALAMFDKELDFGPYIKRIVILPTFPKTQGLQCKVAGWGSINEAGVNLKKLKKVTQMIWNGTSCSQYMGKVKGTFCASQGQGSYPYKGDSGSGLIVPDGSYVLIGVVAFRGPGKTDLVAYTNITFFYSWIVRRAHHMYCASAIGNKKLKLKKKEVENETISDNLSKFLLP